MERKNAVLKMIGFVTQALHKHIFENILIKNFTANMKIEPEDAILKLLYERKWSVFPWVV